MSTIFVFFEQTFIRTTNTVAFFAEFSSVLPFFELYTFFDVCFGKELHFIPCTFVHLKCDMVTEQNAIHCYTINKGR